MQALSQYVTILFVGFVSFNSLRTFLKHVRRAAGTLENMLGGMTLPGAAGAGAQRALFLVYPKKAIHLALEGIHEPARHERNGMLLLKNVQFVSNFVCCPGEVVDRLLAVGCATALHSCWSTSFRLADGS